MEEFIITSPLGSHRNKLMNSLDSALTRPDEMNLPRLRSQGDTDISDRSLALKEYTKARENRVLTFSSDNEDDDEKNLATTPAEYDQDNSFFGQDLNEANSADTGGKISSPKAETSELVAQPQEIPAKRKRGRPRKTEAEKKAAVITRRSKRIVENPSLRKHHAQEPMLNILGPKPLKAMGLAFGGFDHSPSEALLLSKRASGKQKPLTIDAERLHTSSSRDKRFNLNTLDVLRQFVAEHNPKGNKNEIINENVVLDEFKAHLIYHIDHLMDLHASVRDISNDIAEAQRRKNQIRRNILELKQKHALVGSHLNKARKEYNDSRLEHNEFLSMAQSLNELKAAVADPHHSQSNLNDKVLMDLDDVSRICHQKHGLQKQLQRVNTKLAQMANPS